MNAYDQNRFACQPIQDWVTRECDAGRLTGGVLKVKQAGQTVASMVFGIRGADGSPMTGDTAFWIASMTKPIVSVAAMALVERGHLSLNDPVASFIPGFGERGVRQAEGRIVDTARPPVVMDLLTHLSGVTYGQFGERDIHARYIENMVYDFGSDNAQMAERIAELPLLYQPGTVFEYGMSTDILGRVIEVVTNSQLDVALAELVLDPLHMNATSFLPDPGKVAHIPTSPIQQTLAPPLTPTQTWWSGGGGLFSTLEDYLRFTEMLRQGGSLVGNRVVKAQTLHLMRQNHLPDGVGYGDYISALGITAPWQKNGLGFGLGFAVRTKRSDNLPGGLGEHFWAGVSGANFWVDPENDLIAVLLTHAPEHRAEHRIGFRNAVYAGLKERIS